MILFVKFLPLLFFILAIKENKKRTHPIFVSVTNIKYNNTDKHLQISVKMFMDNIEDALVKLNKTKIDIANTKYKNENNIYLKKYLTDRFIVSINGKKTNINYIGHEVDDGAIICYLEVENKYKIKKMAIENSILYDYLNKQINIVHTDIYDNSMSAKISNPEKKMIFIF